MSGKRDDGRDPRATVWIFFHCGCRLVLHPPVKRVPTRCAEHEQPHRSSVEIVGRDHIAEAS